MKVTGLTVERSVCRVLSLYKEPSLQRPWAPHIGQNLWHFTYTWWGLCVILKNLDLDVKQHTNKDAQVMHCGIVICTIQRLTNRKWNQPRTCTFAHRRCWVMKYTKSFWNQCNHLFLERLIWISTCIWIDY